MISYPFVLAVQEVESEDLVYFVTAEKSVIGTSSLCAFDSSGLHLNFGPWPPTATLKEFIEQATPKVEFEFHLSPPLKITEVSQRKRWLRIF